MMRSARRSLVWTLLGLLAASQSVSHARAELALSHLIVQLQPGQKTREDIEVLNNSPDRAYVVVEPSEIMDAGKPSQRRTQEQDPERRGLLVTPARMILEPGQRKLLRLSALVSGNPQERVYRITVKPVAGELQSTAAGLKILVGYDVLVLVRPTKPQAEVQAQRVGNELRLRNIGNSSIELVDGRQCRNGTQGCEQLPGKRLYAGAEWAQPLTSDAPVEYTVIFPEKSVRTKF